MRQRENMKSTLQKYVTIVFGVVLVAFAISVFYTPNKIVSGGVSGVSTIFYHMLGVQPGLSFAVINILLLALAWKFLGFVFVKDTILGAALLSLFVQLFSYCLLYTSDAAAD